MAHSKKIYVANDHAGLELKQALCDGLESSRIVDLGTNDTNSVDYPDFAQQLAQTLLADKSEAFGLLICGTGIGMSIAANRIEGIRAALCTDIYSAEMTRRHNNANVLCLGARVVGPGLAKGILETFLHTQFEGGRHQRRLDKLKSIQ